MRLGPRAACFYIIVSASRSPPGQVTSELRARRAPLFSTLPVGAPPQKYETQGGMLAFFGCMFLWSHGVPRFCVTLVPFGVTWVPFGLHFGSIWEPFAPKVAPNGALWMHFSCQKTDWGAKGAPRGATTKMKSSFGDLPGVTFHSFIVQSLEIRTFSC